MKYSPFTKFIHRVIIFLGVDGWMTRIPVRNHFFRKLVPGNAVYSHKLRKIKRDGTWFELDLSDYMQWHIFSREKEIAWEKAIGSVNPGEPASIIDIGSNVGAFTLKIAGNTADNKDLRLIAFDPNPFVEEKFKKNLSLNPGIEQKVSFQLAAVGNENKIVDFSFDRSNSGAGKVGTAAQEVFPTKVVTLDHFVAENKIQNIRFIKVDVEGFEPFVFEGAAQTLRDQKPSLYFEITEAWHKNYGTSAVKIFELLTEIGYTFYADRNGTLKKTEDYRADISAAFQNNFFAEYK